MTFDQYQKEVLRTAAMDRGSDFETMVFALGLCGEAAELAAAPDDIKEAGDVMWYLAALADKFGIRGEHLIYGGELSDVEGFSGPGLLLTTGRLAELVKKEIGHKKPGAHDRKCELINDVLNYLAMRFDLNDVATMNIAKLRARYPNGWDVKIAAAKPDSTDVTVTLGGQPLTGETLTAKLGNTADFEITVGSEDPPNHFRPGTAHFDSESGEWKPGPV